MFVYLNGEYVNVRYIMILRTIMHGYGRDLVVETEGKIYRVPDPFGSVEHEILTKGRMD